VAGGVATVRGPHASATVTSHTPGAPRHTPGLRSGPLIARRRLE
jgi:hypothetical protein